MLAEGRASVRHCLGLCKVQTVPQSKFGGSGLDQLPNLNVSNNTIQKFRFYICLAVMHIV